MDYKKLIFNRLNIYLLLFGSAFLRVIYMNTKDLSSNNFKVGNNSSILIGVLLICILMYCLKNKRYWTLIILFGITTLVYIRIMPRFSPIDESVHFDYINQIIKSKRIPNVGENLLYDLIGRLNFINISGSQNYELVQPPLYYIICSLFGVFINNILVRFYLTRVIGAVVTAIVLIIIYNTYKLLCEKNIIKKNDSAFILCLIILVFSSGFLVRMLTISNESLAVLLVTATFYQIVKILLSDSVMKKDVIIVSILITLAVLTKLTTAYVAGILFLVMLYKKKITSLIYTIVIGLIGVGPWVIMNIVRYGSITGTKQHLDIVLPIVNPSHVPIKVMDIVRSLPTVISTFWFPEESGAALGRPENLLVIYLMGFISVLLIIIVIKSIMDLVLEVLKKNITASCFILGMFSLGIIVNLIMLMTGSVSTGVNVMIGRYLYLTLLPFVFLLYSFISKLDNKSFFLVAIFLVVFSVVNNELTAKEFLGSIDISKYKNVSKNILEVVCR